MTKEQEKMFVQQGDVVLVQGVVDKAYKSGDLLVRFKTEFGVNSHAWIGKEYVGKSWAVAPEKPKYDPCRLFRAGDRVTPKVVNGRDFNNIAEEMKGKVLIVTKDENRLCNVYVRDGEDEFTIDPAYLELVTPVEELEPYSVQESEVVQGFDIVRDKLCVMSFPCGAKECGWYYNRLAAKEAAVAECARMNAEYRKEQK